MILNVTVKEHHGSKDSVKIKEITVAASKGSVFRFSMYSKSPAPAPARVRALVVVLVVFAFSKKINMQKCLETNL